MEESEYYKISKENDLPLRCPILNYCSRRAWTIYLFSEYSKYDPSLNMVQALQKAGEIPNDFEENQFFDSKSPFFIRILRFSTHMSPSEDIIMPHHYT